MDCFVFGTNVAGIPELLDSEVIFPKNSYKKLADLLLGINKKMLIDKALNNYKESRKYNEEILEKRRESFLTKFKEQR